MVKKPTYEELEQKVKELEKETLRRKEFEEVLGKSKEQYHDLYENAPNAYFSVSAEDGSILRCNTAALKLLGYDRDTLMGMKVFDLYADNPHGISKAQEVFKRFKKGESIRGVEMQMKHKDGYPIWISLLVEPVRDHDGNIIESRSIVIDITEHKRTEKSLRESEAQKGAILDASIDRLRYVDKDMKIIWANKATAIGLDMSPEDIVGQTCYKLFIGRDRPCEGCPTVRARETSKIEQAIMHHPKAKGIEGASYWNTYCVPLKNDAGEIESFILIARNITDQKRAEEHIHLLTQDLMKAQESERQMISRELHDRVAQELSAVKIGLETLFDNQPTTSPEIRQRISEMSRTLQESIKAVRDLSYDLRPPVLDEMGLVQTLFQYCHDFSENDGINVDFHSAGMKDLKLDFDTEINLYRLIQEGLTNIKKHANADHVTIRLVAAFPNIILRIEDNGRGFDVQKRLATITKEKRMGIRSMEERVKLLQGEMELQSRPRQGTKISIKLPYKENKSDS